MAHRIYAYNIDSKTNQTYEGYLGEWNYVIPDLLLPLFSGNPRAQGKSLYFDKEEGIKRLSIFYDLLTDTYHLAEHTPFTEAVSMMFEFLVDLPFDGFYVDATDVYTMNEEKPKEQARQWVEEIRQKWEVYQRAIDQEDLSVLDEVIRASGYTSFLEALEHDWVNFGLGYWEESRVKQTRSVVFHEGHQQGLKDKNGAVLIPPIFDVIYAFSEVHIAVVEKEGKYGYLNDQGKLLVAVQYDDAFDAYAVNHTKVGIACLGGKMGLLNLDTQAWSILPQYDEVEQLYDQYYNVLKNGYYQLVDYKGNPVVSETSVFPFALDYPLAFFAKQEGTSKRKYYSLSGQFLGEYPEGAVEDLPLNYYWIKPNKYQKKSRVINPKGVEVLADIDQLMVFDGYTTFAYKTNKQWRLFDFNQGKHLLPTVRIEKLHADYLCHYMPEAYVIRTVEGYGFYHAASDCWLIEPDEQNIKIEHLNQEWVLLIQKAGHYYYDFQTRTRSERYDYVCAPIDSYSQRACLFVGTMLYYLDDEGNRVEVSQGELGRLYEQRYNLRGKDLAFFTAFYEDWVKRVGEDYEEYLDSDTLYQRGNAAIAEGEWEKAIRYFSVGALRKDPRMLYELGVIYTDENAWTDLGTGIAYLEEAADQDYADAWNTLGYLYQNGIGYACDVDEAIRAYERAVALGCVWANQNLGDLYFYGQQVEQDFDKALTYYVLSEWYYGAYAQNLVEIHYQRREFEQVFKYLRRNKDQPYVHIYYGILYDCGYGVKQSEKKAIEHYERAIEHSSYFYAVERLMYYYGEHPNYQNTREYERLVEYAKANEIDVK